MSRFQKFLFICALVLVVVYSARGRGQTGGSASGVVVGFFAPPAIDHGLLVRFSRAPDSAEARMRSAIQLGNRALDRVGARRRPLSGRPADRQVPRGRLVGVEGVGTVGGVREQLGTAVLRQLRRDDDRPLGRRGSGRAGAVRASGRRVRAGGVPRAHRVQAERHVLFEAVEPARHRHGARLGHSAGGGVEHHRRGPRHGRRLHERDDAVSRERVSDERSATIRRWAI